MELILTRSAGQPWLVNALCREACFDSEAGRDRSRTITDGDILDAQERLIAPAARLPVERLLHLLATMASVEQRVMEPNWKQ